MPTPRQTAAGLLFFGAFCLLATALYRMGIGAAPPAPEPAAPAAATEALPDDFYPDRDWDDYHGHSLHMSVFPFRDRNRNGRYDTGDMPMASVAVVLDRPDGSQRMKRSNVNGYTNFDMYDGEGETDINRAGPRYTFTVEAPPGWHVTTGNARQATRFKRLAGSPAGLVAESPPDVVGLAPDLTIGGRLPVNDAGTRFFLAGPGDRQIQLAADAEGYFSAPVLPGRWRLLAERDGDSVTLHEVSVDEAPVVLSAVSEVASRPPPLPRREVQRFDHLHRSVIDKLASGDHGLRWNYLLATDNQLYRGPGFVNVLRSGHAVGYNSSGHPVTIASATPGGRFDFVGAYFGTAWAESEGEMLDIEAWRGSHRVAQDSVKLSHLGPAWFQADYRDITRVELRTRHYWQFITEDMAFRLPAEATSAQVPAAPDVADNILQRDVFPDDGPLSEAMCAPVAVANAIAGSAGSPSVEQRLGLARKLAGDDYMGTRPVAGTDVLAVIHGLQRYAQARGTGLDALAYVGEARLPWHMKQGYRVDASWLREALANGASVVLNLGWYSEQDDGELARTGGHWVQLLAVDDVGALRLYDPGQATAAAARVATRLEDDALQAGAGSPQRFRLSDTGRSLLAGYPLPAGADRVAIDGALAWRFSEAAPGPVSDR